MTKPFDLQDAVKFLRADLAWSDDFDSIRDSLADLLEAMQTCNTEQVAKLEPALTNLISDLLDDITPK